MVFEFVDGRDHGLVIYGLDVEGVSHIADHGDIEGSTEMFPEVIESGQEAVVIVHGRVIEAKAKIAETLEDVLLEGLGEIAFELGVGDIECRTECDPMAVEDFKMGDLFELVSRPVAKVEGPGLGELERIAAAGDMIEMEFG